MDLTIDDVADLLSISQKTIHSLVSEGKIPFYQIDQKVRFDRMEIEKWMVDARMNRGSHENSSEVTEQKGGTQQFSFYRALHKGDVIRNLEGVSKEEVIQNAMQMAAPILGLDADVLSELLIDRERLMTTALNHGIAVPHPRDLVLKGPLDRIIVVFPKTPLDWDSLDGSLVHTLFFLFSSADKRHLHLLAKVAHLASNNKALDFLKSKPTKEALLDYIRDWESCLRTN